MFSEYWKIFVIAQLYYWKEHWYILVIVMLVAMLVSTVLFHRRSK
jgi:hypothetical protein